VLMGAELNGVLYWDRQEVRIAAERSERPLAEEPAEDSIDSSPLPAPVRERARAKSVLSWPPRSQSKQD
jgi:hypothetical protein